MSVFLDASYYLAFFNEFDIHHQKAKNISQRLDNNEYNECFTTDHILDEIISVALRKWGKQQALKIGKTAIETTTIIISDGHLTNETWKLFQKTDLTLNFTDCNSVITCETFGIEPIITFDKEFKNTSLKVIDE